MKKENSIITPIICAILFTIVGVFLFVSERDVLFDNPVEFYELAEKGGIEKDVYVELYVDGVIGNYAETKHYTNFIPTGTDQHYMLWLQNEEIISLTLTDKKVMEKLDRICDDTWEYIESDAEYYNVQGTTIKGKIYSIDPEIKGYYKQWLDETGITDAGLVVNYFTIDASVTPLKQWLYLLFCLAMVVGSIVWIVIALKKKKDAKEAEEFAMKLREANAANTEQATDDLDAKFDDSRFNSQFDSNQFNSQFDSNQFNSQFDNNKFGQ